MERVKISCHPDYEKWFPIWEKLYIVSELGEDGVKMAGTRFLPKTEGQIEDGDDGEVRYQAYKTRATFYNFVHQTIKKAMGLLHSKDAVLVSSDKLAKWTQTMTVDKEDLRSLGRDISSAQLLLGRIGLLIDYPEDGAYYPYVVKYSADAILCWDEKIVGDENKLQWVLLDDTGYEFNETSKAYEKKIKYRLLALDSKGIYYTVVLDDKGWNQWDIKNPKGSAEYRLIYPKMPKATIDFIPFIPVNIKNTAMTPQEPLLVDLANISLSAYRADADYRQGLYAQAFALLYLIGFNEEKTKKKGVRSDGFVVTDNPNAKVGYASAPADGLTEQRMSIEALKDESHGNGIVIADKEGVESGKALKTRIALQTSDLQEISLTAQEAITKLLSMVQKFIGDTKKFTYTTNHDFNQEKATSREYLDFWNVCISGGTSLKNIYYWASKNELAYEATYEEWLANNQESLNILGYTPQTADSNSEQRINSEQESKENENDATDEDV